MQKYSNIFYFYNINSIGGVETFFYYLAKKYCDFDITVFYSTGDINQIKRLRKYVRVKKYKTGEIIKCKKAFFNYNPAIIDNVEADEYIQVIHCDYKGQNDKPKINPKITKYIGVSQLVCDTFEELTGKKCELCYNPLSIDKPKKILKLVSATRLTSEKGKDRMVRLGNILNAKGIDYIWLIFTNDENAINNPNIIYMKPRLDIINYMKEADFLIQLSTSESYCFSVIESLYACNKPVIVTYLPVYKELGLNDTNSIRLALNFDDIDEKLLYKKYRFQYEPPEDNWSKLLAKGKNTYKEEMNKLVSVECIKEYDDLELNRKIKKGEILEVNTVRADELMEYPPLVKEI